MFSYITLKNFMSFKDVTFDFRNGSNNVKKFVAIYGENGSGKSNFINSIDFLCKTITSFRGLKNSTSIRDLLDSKEKTIPADLLEVLYSNFDIQGIMNKCRMVECDEDTFVEYGFLLNGYEGYYSLKFGDKIHAEKLYYFTGKQRGVMFDISYEDGKIQQPYMSNKLFSSNKIELEYLDEIQKYWGKHTFMSLIQKERDEKNETYISENVLSYIIDVLDMFKDISLFCKKSNSMQSGIKCRKPYNVMEDLSSGKVEKNSEYQLESSEKILREFFTQAYADIKDVYYEKKVEEEEIEYKLMVKKMIGGKVRTINFNKESSGTQQILEIIRSLLGAFCGVTVVYDEIDDGIHDLLLKSVIGSMTDQITGQLIITTHNTLLLESVGIKSAYVIKVDYQGNKEVKCLDKFPRIQGTNNPRTMYLKGLFGGVPYCDYLDYDEIILELNSTSEGGE